MSAEKETRVVEVLMNGSQAGATMKTLGGDIRALQAHIRNLTPGTEEFRKAVARLHESKAQFKALDDQVKNVSKGMSGFKAQMMASFGGNLLAGGIQGAFSTIKGFLSESAAQFSEAEQVNARLNATLTSTGHAAGLTAGELDKMATGLMNVTTFDDDVIKGGQAMLLTFTNIGKDVFPRATESVLNMAEVFGSVETASVQVGKALNDPIRGVTALRKAGVSFSVEQMNMIKSMQLGGDMAGAQAIILKELEKEFGGVARAAAETSTGGIKQFHNAIGNLQEELGEKLIVGLGKLAIFGKDFIANMGPVKDAIQPIIDAVQSLGNKLYQTGKAFGIFNGQLSAGANMANVLGGAIKLVLWPFKILGGSIYLITEGLAVMVNAGKEAANFFGANFKINPKMNLETFKKDAKELGDTIIHPLKEGEKGIQDYEKVAYASIKKLAEAGDWEAQEELIRRKETFKSKVKDLRDYTSMSLEELKTIDSEEAKAEIKRREAQQKYNENSKKLLEEAKQIEIEVIKEEETRELARLQNKLQNKIADVQATEAGTNEKNRLITALTEQHEKDVTTLKEKYQKERDDKEYTDSVNNLAAWHDRELIMIGKQFVDGLISEEEYNKQILDLEDKTLQSKLTLANDYGKSTIEIEKQIIDAEIKLKKDKQKQLEQEFQAHLELQVKYTEEGTRARLDAETDLLNFQMQQALALEGKTEEEKKLIRDHYRALEEEAENAFISARINKAVEVFQQYTGQAMQAYGSISTIIANRENAELESEKKGNDEKKKALKKQLDSKLISQESYNEKVAALDEASDRKAREIKRKQAEREKKAKLFEATINMFSAIAKSIAVSPETFGLPFSAFAAIQGGLQIAAIAGAPLPELDHGGPLRVKGMSGNSYNATYGGSLEGYYSTPTLALVSEKKPEYVIPHRVLQKPGVANIVGMLEGMRVREYDSGGSTGKAFPITQTAANTNSTADMQEMKQILGMVATALFQLSAKLDEPIEAFINYDRQLKVTNEITSVQESAGIKA
jgi:hypothetical protein